MNILISYIISINILAYLMMWTDKVKSIYNWWRVSERTLWILALCGGVFGIWLGMHAPIYHKAGKAHFRIWIPILAGIWISIYGYFLL